jgi:hypothetical protein
VTSTPERGGLPGLAEIAAEIQALRKNRAFSGDVSEKIGPVLLELAGGDFRKANERLGRELRALAGRLTEEMRTAILAALALHQDTRGMTTYSQRKRWLANTKLDRGDRTAERRIEEAQRLLAQEIATELERRRGQSDAADDGWYIDHFSAVLLLDGDSPEAIEQRRIVATRHHLTEITIVLDTPRESGQRRLGLKADVTSGGKLVRAEELSRNRTRYIVRLPRPLQPDETHEYEMHIWVAPDEPMRDYYVFRPERRCDGFDLRVRFDRRNPPAWVRQVVGEDVHVYYPYEGAPRPAERVPVDGTGEARASFPRPRQHLGYGLQWSFSDEAPADGLPSGQGGLGGLQRAAEHLAQLGTVRVPVLVDGVRDGGVEDLLLGAGDGECAAYFVRYRSAVDHFPGHGGPLLLISCCDSSAAMPGSSRPPVRWLAANNERA